MYCRALQSQCLGGLVTFFSKKFDDPETLAAEKQYAYYYAAGMILCTVVRTLFTSPFMLYATHLGLQVRVSIAAMIFRKVCRNLLVLFVFIFDIYVIFTDFWRYFFTKISVFLSFFPFFLLFFTFSSNFFYILRISTAPTFFFEFCAFFQSFYPTIVKYVKHEK